MENKDKNKDQGDSAAVTEAALGDSITSSRDAHHTNRDLSSEGSLRCCPSQAGSGSCSKGDGQGSHALPGLTQ